MTGGPTLPTSSLPSTPTSIPTATSLSSGSQSPRRQSPLSVQDHVRSAVQSAVQRIQARVMSQGQNITGQAGQPGQATQTQPTGPTTGTATTTTTTTTAPPGGAGPTQAGVGHVHGATGGIVDLPLPGTKAAPKNETSFKYGDVRGAAEDGGDYESRQVVSYPQCY